MKNSIEKRPTGSSRNRRSYQTPDKVAGFFRRRLVPTAGICLVLLWAHPNYEVLQAEPLQGSIVDVLPAHQAESGLVTRAELHLVEDWMARMVSVNGEDSLFYDGWLGTALPFSFQYNDKSFLSLVSGWQLERRGQRVDSDCVSQELVWTDQATGLKVIWKLKRFIKFPAVEWVLEFENGGSQDTPIIKGIQALDLRLNTPLRNEPYVVHGVRGGRSKSDDMKPFSETLLPNGSLATQWLQLGTAPPYADGRSASSNNNLPFFNVETPDNRGLVVGIGWSGSWSAQLELVDTKLRLSAGLRETHFSLHPGEKVRTPRILLTLWEGKRLHGQNIFRRLLYSHYVPHLRGKPQEPLVSVNVCFTRYGLGANEKDVLTLIDPFIRLGTELLIIDAEWFRGTPWYEWLGNWTYSRDKYPRGLKPISQLLGEADVGFGLWFGPELATANAPVAKEHPEFLRQEKGRRWSTVQIDQPEAREWFLGQVDELIQKQGMTCYRQDLSGKFADEPEDRVGISESHHVAGLYELWDTLKRRHPNLIMEGCCAGGRRIDLETISRFHWHQKSDRWFDSESDQTGLYGANLFLPGGIINIPTRATDDYGAWSAFAGQFCLAWNPQDEGFPAEQARGQVELYKQIRSLLSGDFYPLTPASVHQTWIGYQFHRPDLDKGFALIFRRGNVKPLTPAGHSVVVSLRGLQPETQYRVHYKGKDTVQTLAGQALAKPIEIVIPTETGAEMIIYEGTK